MPARITVSVLTELLGRSQALTDANREKLLEREADQRADRKRLEAKGEQESAAKVGVQPDPVGRNIFTAAASAKGYPLALSFVSGGDTDLTVWSRDGVASVNVSLPEPPPAPPDVIRAEEFSETQYLNYAYGYELTRRNQQFTLPINKDNLIHYYWRKITYRLVMRRVIITEATGEVEGVLDQTYVGDAASETGRHAFVAGRTAVRAIGSGGLDAIVAGINATNESLSLDNHIGESPASSYLLEPPDPLWATPGIFSVLRNPSAGMDPVLFEETPSEVIAALVEALLAGLYPSVGLAACALDGTCSVERYGFDYTPTPSADAPVYRRNRAADLVGPLDDWPGALAAGWDWGKPGYCREQLLALGFSGADLTP